MQQEMVLISKPIVELMLVQLHRAERYCSNAQSINAFDDPVAAEPTATYAGASGYSAATMRDVIQTLESACEESKART